MDLRYDSIAALIEAAKQSGRKLSELVLEQQAVQMEQSADELYEIMRKSYAVMAASVEEGKAPGVRSASGLSGGDAYRMARAEREAVRRGVLRRAHPRACSQRMERGNGPYRCGAHGRLLRNSAGRRAHVAGRA